MVMTRSSDGEHGSDNEANAHSIGSDIRNTVSEAAQNAKEQARDVADDVKAQSVNRVEGVSRAVHGAADQLGRELPQAAGFIHSTAERHEDATAALSESSVEELASTFSDFARRQPAAAFAGSVLAGFALSRFLKSSVPRAGNRQ
jgi:hypothetical protein